MKKEQKNSFRGKIVTSSDKQKEARGGRSYLNLPKGVDMFKFPENVRSFQLDFLPYIVTNPKHLDRNETIGVATPDTIWFRSAFKVHRNVGQDNASVICPATFGKKCPICEYRVKRIKEGADKEEYKLLYPQDRSLYIVLPIGHKDYDEVPYVWDMADFLFQETLIDELRENEENEDFFTLNNGKTADVRLKWKEIGKNNFPEVVSITFIDRESYPDSTMDEIPKLDDLFKVLTYKEISAKFFEEEFEEEDGGLLHEIDDDNPPTTRTRRSLRGTQAQEEKQIEEEEEEEEKPNLPKRSLRQPQKEVEEQAPKHTRSTRVETIEKTPCPNGHVFGKDFEKFDDCDDCDKWSDCLDESKKR